MAHHVSPVVLVCVMRKWKEPGPCMHDAGRRKENVFMQDAMDAACAKQGFSTLSNRAVLGTLLHTNAFGPARSRNVVNQRSMLRKM